jgi:hypothetical protein
MSVELYAAWVCVRYGIGHISDSTAFYDMQSQFFDQQVHMWRWWVPMVVFEGCSYLCAFLCDMHAPLHSCAMHAPLSLDVLKKANQSACHVILTF